MTTQTNTLYRLYYVQTYLGTYSKTFQNRYNAEKYYKELSEKMGDKNLVEFTSNMVDTLEYNYTDIED